MYQMYQQATSRVVAYKTLLSKSGTLWKCSRIMLPVMFFLGLQPKRQIYSVGLDWGYNKPIMRIQPPRIMVDKPLLAVAGGS